MFRFEERPITIDEITPLKNRGETQRFVLWTNPHGTLGYLIITESGQFRAQCENEISEEFKHISFAFKWMIDHFRENRERREKANG